jgi:hypothetical protein
MIQYIKEWFLGLFTSRCRSEKLVIDGEEHCTYAPFCSDEGCPYNRLPREVYK